MQLIAGRTAQAYNRRKYRKGAFWEDRYHATAVQTDEHFIRCMVYIDLNMVRAGVVRHPENWAHCGYQEIQQPPKRYQIIDRAALIELCQFASHAELRLAHGQWIIDALQHEESEFRDPRWSESVAVGQLEYVEAIHKELGCRSRGRTCTELLRHYNQGVSNEIGFLSISYRGPTLMPLYSSKLHKLKRATGSRVVRS
jgi:putative transposase